MPEITADELSAWLSFVSTLLSSREKESFIEDPDGTLRCRPARGCSSNLAAEVAGRQLSVVEGSEHAP
jgi:hypothetical protein